MEVKKGSLMKIRLVETIEEMAPEDREKTAAYLREQVDRIEQLIRPALQEQLEWLRRCIQELEGDHGKETTVSGNL